MTWQDWIVSVGATIIFFFVMHMIWDLIGYFRLAHALNREANFQRDRAILMNDKDLAHFLFDAGLAPDPDAEPEPAQPRKSMRGLQSVELD